MAHHVSISAYRRLTDRLNRFPQGAPPSDLLFKILKMLFAEAEAEQVAMLPIRPFTARQAAAIWKTDENRARAMLDRLAERALLVDFEENGRLHYVLPPPMAGFFEFSLMRVRRDIDQKLLSELFFE
jgi:Fic family protein